MKKVLCIVNLMSTGGAETFLMKLLRAIDRDIYKMDFMTTVDEEGHYDAEIKRLGGNIYHMSNLKWHPVASMYKLYRILKNNIYDAVFLSTNASVYGLLLAIAKCAGVRRTGLRSTNSQLPQSARLLRALHRLFFFVPKYVADVKIAPSLAAAEFMFGKSLKKNEVRILYNGLDTDAYKFHYNSRCRIRKALNIDDNMLLIGHIGRFEAQKNHDFILRTFAEIIKDHEAKLILIGEGKKRKDVEQKATHMGLGNSVSFLGVRADIPDLLMGMDGMIFPSLYEGLPNVIMEAQSTGLPCLISDTITRECRITDIVEFASLSDSPIIWAGVLEKMIGRNTNRESYSEIVKMAGYGIEKVKDDFIEMMFM